MSCYRMPPWANAPQHKWTLLEIKGGVEQTSHSLDKSCVLFGRAADEVDIVLQHASSSRQHARIAFDASGTPWFRDLASTHGVTVNKKRLPMAAIGKEESNSTKAGARGVVIFPGDLLMFGASTRIYCLEGPPEFARGEIRKVVPFDKKAQVPTAAIADRSNSTGTNADLSDNDESAGLAEMTDEKIPDVHRKEWERVKALRYKLDNIRLESERIRVKGELSSGQERQLARNEEKISSLEGQINEKEMDLSRKLFAGRSHSTNRTAHPLESQNDDNEEGFFDKTKDKDEDHLELNKDVETEASLMTKWKQWQQQRSQLIAETKSCREKGEGLSKRVEQLLARGDEESFFAQNDLDLAKDSMLKLEAKKEKLEKKLEETASLLRIVNANLKPDVESGDVGGLASSKPNSLPAIEADALPSEIHVSVDRTELALTDGEVALSTQAGAAPVIPAVTGVPAKVALKPGDFTMLPPPSKKRQRLVGVAMPPPSVQSDDRRPKRTAHAALGTLAGLSAIQSKTLSAQTAESGKKRKPQIQGETTKGVAIDDKKDVWQAPIDQDGSGITKLNAKFAGRY